jgi:hypothetical protein
MCSTIILFIRGLLGFSVRSPEFRPVAGRLGIYELERIRKVDPDENLEGSQS